MDVREMFELVAKSYGWQFVPARRDYQNLTDAVNFIHDEMEGYGIGETVFFLDPVQMGAESIGIRYQGNFMVLTKSDIDDDYESKYKKYIKPLIPIVLENFKNKIRCEFPEITDWIAIEVINVFDFNGDGLSVRFDVTG